jgi:hypothetical protein
MAKTYLSDPSRTDFDNLDAELVVRLSLSSWVMLTFSYILSGICAGERCYAGPRGCCCSARSNTKASQRCEGGRKYSKGGGSACGESSRHLEGLLSDSVTNRFVRPLPAQPARRCSSSRLSLHPSFARVAAPLLSQRITSTTAPAWYVLPSAHLSVPSLLTELGCSASTARPTSAC